ncbi:MAG TPA: NFACT RNA binding domain-containing protein [Chlamydiales bacterium]|nr:NFACT RNA binding domain-containing protein [Chlamydiales bacterium]
MNSHSTQETEKNRVRRAIIKRMKRIEKGIVGKQNALQEALNASFIEHQGELLKASFHALKPAMKEIILSDWLQENKPITIQLDPDLTPPDHLKAFFKRAKKLKRAVEPLEKPIHALQEEKKLWEARLHELTLITTEEELHQFQEKYRVGLKTEKKELIVAPKKKKSDIHTFYSVSHHVILVGTSAKENDHLTFQIAKGDDLWLHASQTAGAHVVIRKKGATPIDKESIAEAATLALYFSKHRSDPEAVHEVVMTERKNVHRLKGAPAGKVSIASFKTIRLRIDKGRLEQIKGRKGT